MASRRKNKNLVKRMRKQSAPLAKAAEILSETWYTNKQVWKILDISASTAKRWRASGALIASKRFGKVYFNHTHVQNLLKSGLKSIITGATFLL